MIAVAWLGCSVEDRLPIELPVRAGPLGEAAFTRPDGAEVALTAAVVTFSDLRLEEPAEADGSAWLRALWPVSEAVAHPGHDPSGSVAAELLGTFTVDLLGDDVPLGVADGYEGAFATGRVHVAGTAASFTGTFTPPGGEPLPLSIDVAADQDVLGIPFPETLDAEAPPASVDLRFDLAAALAFVEAQVVDEDGDGALTAADATFANTVRFGVVATPTWSLTLVP